MQTEKVPTWIAFFYARMEFDSAKDGFITLYVTDAGPAYAPGTIIKFPCKGLENWKKDTGQTMLFITVSTASTFYLHRADIIDEFLQSSVDCVKVR